MRNPGLAIALVTVVVAAIVVDVGAVGSLAVSVVIVGTEAMVAACLVDVEAADIGIVVVFNVVVVVAALVPELLKLPRGARRRVRLLWTLFGRSAVFPTKRSFFVLVRRPERLKVFSW